MGAFFCSSATLIGFFDVLLLSIRSSGSSASTLSSTFMSLLGYLYLDLNSRLPYPSLLSPGRSLSPRVLSSPPLFSLPLRIHPVCGAYICLLRLRSAILAILDSFYVQCLNLFSVASRPQTFRYSTPLGAAFAVYIIVSFGPILSSYKVEPVLGMVISRRALRSRSWCLVRSCVLIPLAVYNLCSYSRSQFVHLTNLR